MKHLAGMIAVLAVAVAAWLFLRDSRSDVAQTQQDASNSETQRQEKEQTPDPGAVPGGGGTPKTDDPDDASPDPSPQDDPVLNAPPVADPAADATSPDTTSPNTTLPPPWEETLAADPVPHLRFRFQPLGDERRHIDETTLAEWLEPAGPGGTLKQSRGRPVVMEGLFRLRAPWPEQAVLRMNLGSWSKGIRIHVFHQQHGVLLVNSQAPRPRWNAYLTQRTRPDAMPDDRRLAVDDRSRGRLLRGRRHTPLEFHWNDGLLRLVNGDTTLLAAPLPGRPTEMFIEGTATIYGVDMWRSSTTPDLPHRISSDPAPLGGLNWSRDHLGEGVRLYEDADGAMVLETSQETQPGWAFASLPPGLQHVELEVEADPGFGVYLGNADGKPGEMLRWAHNEQDENQLTAYRTEDPYRGKTRIGHLPQYPSARVGGRHWVRLLAGPRSLQWWIGQDGHHWAAPDVGRQSRPLSGATLGVMYGTNTVGKLRIHQVRTAPLIALTRWGQQLGAAPAHPAIPPSSQHLPPCESPKDVAAVAWRRIVAGETRPEDPRRLYDGATDLTIEERSELLIELSRWLSVEGHTSEQQWLTDEAAALAHRVWERDRTAPWTWCLNLLCSMDLPSGNFPPDRYEPLQQLLRRELLGLAAERRWDGLIHSVDRAIFYGEQVWPLLAWAGAVAERNSSLPLQTGGVRGSLHLGTSLWTDQIDKPTFNLLVELQGLIDNEAWDTAAELSTRAAQLEGLAPDPRDGELLTSFANRLAQVCRERPEFRQAMERGAQEVAQLYLDRAVVTGEAHRVRRVARQFPATPAAAEAWMWVGDQSLVTGDAIGAAAAYRQAILQDPYADLSPFQRALVKHTYASPPGADEQDVFDFGGQTLSVNDSKQLIESMIAAPWRAVPPQADSTLPPRARAEARGRLEEPFGRDPRQQVMRYVNERNVDWYGRQLSVVSDGARLFVCNRFQLACFNERGERQWQTSAPGDPKLTAQRARELSRTPCRPVLHGEQLTARLLYGSGGYLQSISTADGSELWVKRAAADQRWASDPVLSHGKLWAALLEQTTDIGDLELSIVQLRPQDGQQIAQLRLGQVRQDWLQDQQCQIAALPDGILLAMGDSLLRVNSDGVCWLRRRSAPPADQDPRRPLEWIEPPLLSADGQRAFVRHPGLPLVQCIQLDTGELLWERLAPGLASLPAVRDNRLLVWTDERLECWDISDSEIVWSKPWQRRCRELLSLPAKGLFVCLAEGVGRLPVWGNTKAVVSIDHNASDPRFAIEWRDWATGRVLGRTQLEGISGDNPRVSDLLPVGEQWWLFHGDGPLDATRTLMQLTPMP